MIDSPVHPPNASQGDAPMPNPNGDGKGRSQEDYPLSTPLVTSTWQILRRPNEPCRARWDWQEKNCVELNLPERDWRDVKKCAVLRVQLPGFQKEQLRLNLDSNKRILKVTGQKPDGFNFTHLNERIKINDNCLLNGVVHAKFEGQILIVAFPQVDSDQQQSQKN